MNYSLNEKKFKARFDIDIPNGIHILPNFYILVYVCVCLIPFINLTFKRLKHRFMYFNATLYTRFYMNSIKCQHIF